MKNLVIVESPAKAKTIEKYLGKDYKVLASMGHIRDLPTKRLGVDIKNNFQPDYELNRQRIRIINELKKAVKNVDKVFLSPDPDREGEAIAWHLYETLKTVTKAEFKRVTFNEITKSAITQAFNNVDKIDVSKVDSQQARRILDRIVGYQVSPLLWSFKRGASSAGRVQTVALRLIVERENAIRIFQPVEYWTLKANLDDKIGGQFEVSLNKINGEKPKINNKEKAQNIVDQLDKQRLKLDSFTTKKRRQKPYPPFITSTLQQVASGTIRMSPAQTMRIAQQLYEQGFITYMRTDSVTLSNEIRVNINQFINRNFGANYAGGTIFKSKAGAQVAHEAIRPTDVYKTPESLKNLLDRNQYNLYSLIWHRTVASQMAVAIFEQKTMEFSNSSKLDNDYLFRATSTENIFQGYLKVYKPDDDKDKETITLPALNIGDFCDILSLDTKQHFTEPPPRFSEASLVKELEANGIGRPSTYASIVRTIQERKYVVKKEGRLHPQDIGEEVCDYLINCLPSLFEVGFTAKMEDSLDKIEEGKLSWTEMLRDFYQNFEQWLIKAKTAGAPKRDKYATIVEIFNNNQIIWEKPRKIGRRIYNDEKYIQSIQEALEKENPLSQKQWSALVKIFFKYAKQINNFEQILENLDLQEQFQKEQVKNQVVGEQNSVDQQLINLMIEVKNWAEPVIRGKRTYDDKVFFESLKTQFEKGRIFSENQRKALVRLIQQYKGQINNCQSRLNELNLSMSEAKPVVENKNLKSLIGLFKEITQWEEPVTKGKRTYDDKSFYESVAKQYVERKTLSDRQIKAIKILLKKYDKQIVDVKRKIQKLGF